MKEHATRYATRSKDTVHVVASVEAVSREDFPPLHLCMTLLRPRSCSAAGSSSRTRLLSSGLKGEGPCRIA